MDFVTIFFYGSLIMIIFMISLKIYVLKEETLSHTFTGSIDEFLRKRFHWSVRIFSRFNTHNLKLSLFFFLRFVYGFISLAKTRLAQRLSKFNNVIQGRKFIYNKGMASFYLQDVLEYKNNLDRE